jgi:hypothetical protein
MNITAKIASLREKRKGHTTGIRRGGHVHETWKPIAYDNDLHRRMRTSYATNTFNIVRVALRRKMVLALLRLDGSEAGIDRAAKPASTIRTPFSRSSATTPGTRTFRFALRT